MWLKKYIATGESHIGFEPIVSIRLEVNNFSLSLSPDTVRGRRRA